MIATSGVILSSLSDGVPTISDFSNRVPIWPLDQKRAQSASDNFMIIGDKDGCHHRYPPTSCGYARRPDVQSTPGCGVYQRRRPPQPQRRAPNPARQP